MKNKRTRLFLLFLFVMLTACTQSNIGALTQTNNDITGTLNFDPDPVEVMTPVTLSLQLADSSGKAIDGAQVSYDLTMPAMPMAPNQPQASLQGNGVYIAETTFSMSGDWQAAVTIEKDGQTSTLTFDFKVK